MRTLIAATLIGMFTTSAIAAPTASECRVDLIISQESERIARLSEIDQMQQVLRYMRDEPAPLPDGHDMVPLAQAVSDLQQNSNNWQSYLAALEAYCDTLD